MDKIPEGIELAAINLLKPYGVDLKKLLATAKEQEAMPKMTIKYYTVSQVKYLYNISRFTVWRAARQGLLKTLKPGGRGSRQGRVLVDRESLENWIEGRTQHNANA